MSFLPVKSLMRLKCVSKSWNTLISDPRFVPLHLLRSQRNRNLLLTYGDFGLVSLPISRLVDNTSLTLSSHQLKSDECHHVIGSCNGLICLFYRTRSTIEFKNAWFRIWNPATGTMSDRLGSFHKSRSKFTPKTLGYTFAYDISTSNYKIVAFGYRFIKVFCFNRNVWREIQSLPDKMVIVDYLQYKKGVSLNGTLFWLAFLNEFPYNDWRDTFSLVRYLIISLDLATETRRELLPPPVFDEVSDVVHPSISVLMNCLCFFYNFKGTHFVVWHMTQFGVKESWTQLFKISFEKGHFLCDFFSQLSLYPLYISENGATLILGSNRECEPIIYNSRDNKVERTRIINEIDWRCYVGYVESLAPIT
ncbi:F-box/kelch-repeat protein At3g23880-like [Vicia villosa]|uniref:F-box/kelch-repeat protein At3g23880-like n=1 Tax=Vicia villosa TaxID=3911 RepID=UPI00273CDD2B|nr:F-box/kelch-repeat protein At3g23880-like [Vicia villosa]